MGIRHSEGAKPIARIKSTTRQKIKATNQKRSGESAVRLYPARRTPPRKIIVEADAGLSIQNNIRQRIAKAATNPHPPFGK
jgi:hypothetical protein